jgi:hypothetical protein
VSGSVKKNGTTWMFVVDIPSPDGKRRQVRRCGFDTKKAAELELRKLLGHADAGTLVEPSKLTLGRYLLETWLPSIATRVRPTTSDMYGRMMRKHVIPALGSVRMQALDAPTVTTFVATLSQKGLSPKPRSTDGAG